MTLSLSPLEGVPLVKPGDDLNEITRNALASSEIILEDGDILVFAQKIISKAEDRFRKLSEQDVSTRAQEIAELTDKAPALVQLILDESNAVLRAQPAILIVEHKLGFVCANAGIDQSNIGKDDDWVLLLPEDPSRSAAEIRAQIKSRTDKDVAILIIDSHGRAWRKGTLGLAIGLSGMPALIDFRGKPDIHGRKLHITTVAASDELAAAASLLMGPADEKRPIIHVRGFPYALNEGKFDELLRDSGEDVFR